MRGDFAPFESKMRRAGLPTPARRAFQRAYQALCAGAPRPHGADFTPLPAPARSAELSPETARIGREALPRCAALKLNGGIATSMKLSRAKILLPWRDGLRFLDLVVLCFARLRESFGVSFPLVWMNSFRTREDTLAALAEHPPLSAPLPVDFTQHKIPRVRADDFSPFEWPPDPGQEWCPPGHGDLYVALYASGMLDALTAAGFRYLFVSNADNMGAVPDPALLGSLVESGAPFVMEVCARRKDDAKGGHLLRAPDGALALRELAQCSEHELADFQDIRRHSFFNTNNLWIDLEALAAALEEGEGVLELPVIRNRKRPAEGAPWVLQLETAAGAAISCFPDARVIETPRTRFMPMKTADQLLALRSDAFCLDEAQRLVPTPGGCGGELEVDLGEAFDSEAQLSARMPQGPPSLLECRRLVVRGDVHFGRGVRIVGDVHISAPPGKTLHIEDHALLKN